MSMWWERWMSLVLFCYACPQIRALNELTSGLITWWSSSSKFQMERTSRIEKRVSQSAKAMKFYNPSQSSVYQGNNMRNQTQEAEPAAGHGWMVLIFQWKITATVLINRLTTSGSVTYPWAVPESIVNRLTKLFNSSRCLDVMLPRFRSQDDLKMSPD